MFPCSTIIMESEGIAESTRQKLTEMEGGQVDHKERLNLIRQIEEAIEKEKAIEMEKKREDEKQRILQQEAEMEKVREAPTSEGARVAASAGKIPEVATTGATVIDAMKVIVLLSFVSISHKIICLKVDPKDLSSIEQILVGGPIHEAKHDLLGLKEKAIEHSEDLVEITALDSAFSETKVAQRLRTKLNTMIDSVDSLVSKLEEEKRMVEETIVDPAMGDSVAAKR
ncbi:hypothetical protein Angca_000220 [Angiostrongylus cantonensis]|nr:hypothetical protein Angca_000220 [Angiostrongylus cantonensis]